MTLISKEEEEGHASRRCLYLQCLGPDRSRAAADKGVPFPKKWAIWPGATPAASLSVSQPSSPPRLSGHPAAERTKTQRISVGCSPSLSTFLAAQHAPLKAAITRVFASAQSRMEDTLSHVQGATERSSTSPAWGSGTVRSFQRRRFRSQLWIKTRLVYWQHTPLHALAEGPSRSKPQM